MDEPCSAGHRAGDTCSACVPGRAGGAIRVLVSLMAPPGSAPAGGFGAPQALAPGVEARSEAWRWDVLSSLKLS